MLTTPAMAANVAALESWEGNVGEPADLEPKLSWQGIGGHHERHHEKKSRAMAGEDESDCELTGREWDVVGWVVQGLSNKEVARQTNTLEGTIKSHLHSIYQKTGVANRTALVAWYKQTTGRR